MNPAQVLDAFSRLSVLVVGDICLDCWRRYDPAASEPSRETGIPRIGVVESESTPGAGGTIANNLAALGAGRIGVLGITGDDGSGYELRRELVRRGVETDYLFSVPGFPTFTYTKLINRLTGEEDLPRVDLLPTRPLPVEIEERLIEALRAAAPLHDAIVISDQAETGQAMVVTPRMREALAALASQLPEKVFWADSRLRAEEFRNVIVKPNQTEAEAACLRLFGNVDHQALLRHIQAPLLVVTEGPQGARLVYPGREERIPAVPVAQPVDICGAGDSFTAAAVCALAVTRDPAEAARFGNLAASITIMQKGTGTASRAELLDRLQRGGAARAQ